MWWCRGLHLLPCLDFRLRRVVQAMLLVELAGGVVAAAMERREEVGTHLQLLNPTDFLHQPQAQPPPLQTQNHHYSSTPPL